MTKYAITITTVFMSLTLFSCTKENPLEQICIETLENCLTEKKSTVINHAGEALTFAGKTDGLEQIFIEMLNKPESDKETADLQKIMAARAMYKLGKKEYIKYALEVLNDPNSPRRHTAAETLGKLRYDKAHDQIKKAISEVKDNPAMWAYGTGAMAMCGDKQAIKEMLEKGFSSPVENVRRITANDLSKIRLPQALPLIKKMTTEEKSQLLRVDAAGSLLCYNDFTALNVLKEGMKSPDPSIRKHSIRLFKMVDDPVYISLLKPFLNDPNPDVRIRTAEAILHIMKNSK